MSKHISPLFFSPLFFLVLLFFSIHPSYALGDVVHCPESSMDSTSRVHEEERGEEGDSPFRRLVDRLASGLAPGHSTGIDDLLLLEAMGELVCEDKELNDE